MGSSINDDRTLSGRVSGWWMQIVYLYINPPIPERGLLGGLPWFFLGFTQPRRLSVYNEV